MKKLSLLVSMLLLSIIIYTIGDNEKALSYEDKFEKEILYLYEDNSGMYFYFPKEKEIDPSIVFVGHEDHEVIPELYINKDNLYYGKPFIAEFYENDYVELKSLKETSNNNNH